MAGEASDRLRPLLTTVIDGGGRGLPGLGELTAHGVAPLGLVQREHDDTGAIALEPFDEKWAS